MRFIEIKNGITVNVRSIDGIEEVDGLTCKVYVGTRVYSSNIPYEALRSLLKNEEVIDTKDDSMSQTMKKVDKILDTAQFFAG